MNIGRELKRAFAEIFKLSRERLLLHKASGTPNAQTIEIVGMKNSEKGRPNDVMFQFPERLEIAIGDLIQQNGTSEMWRIIDLEDEIESGVFIDLVARVERVSARPQPKTLPPPSVIVQGSVFGAIQVNSPNASQIVSVHVQQIETNLQKLKELLKSAPVSEVACEEAEQALDRISQLSKKPRSQEVIALIKEKLELVKVTFEVSKEIAATAAPYIGAIVQAIAL